jgi:hypothetical protein
MKIEDGDWTRYRQMPGLVEVDFHNTGLNDGGSYWEHMEEVRDKALAALRDAQREGIHYILFTHGRSTSRPGSTTSRSVVRGLMRSKEATPFLVRRECIQHESVFLAAIRPKSGGALEGSRDEDTTFLTDSGL